MMTIRTDKMRLRTDKMRLRKGKMRTVGGSRSKFKIAPGCRLGRSGVNTGTRNLIL